MKELEELLKLATKKHKIDIKRGDKKYLNLEWALDEIISEVQEVKDEIKPNNTPYLEDELGDILWGWFMAVEKLKDKGYVRGHKEIFTRTLQKYKERIEPLVGFLPEDKKIWQEVKTKQKRALEIEQFRYNVRDFYKPFYDKGDLAHKIDHANSVCDLALKLNSGKYKEELVILAAYLHDIFNAKDRKNHHKLAFEYVLNKKDKFLQNLSTNDLNLVAHAILEHRGSFKGNFYSKLSEIISSADRGEPNLEKIIIRSLQFNKGNAKEVLAHIKNKYSYNGYGRYPKLYEEYFQKEIKIFKDKVENLTIKDIENLNH